MRGDNRIRKQQQQQKKSAFQISHAKSNDIPGERR